jgi:hypothetical protein
VPGLAAKPILDMMAGVTDLTAALPAIAVLEGHGWVHAPHRPEAYWFYRPSTPVGHEHTHHPHLTEPGSALWRERLAFRDALRAHPALREEYQTLKLRLAQQHVDDGDGYTTQTRVRCPGSRTGGYRAHAKTRSARQTLTPPSFTRGPRPAFGIMSPAIRHTDPLPRPCT